MGGEPLSMKNLDGVKALIEKFRKKFNGTEKKIWLWTGYYKDNFNERQFEVAKMCDYVIDGPFVQSKFNNEIRFKGSTNQTIWEIKDGKFEVSEYN